MGLRIQHRWLVSLILANAIPIKCKILTEIIFFATFFLTLKPGVSPERDLKRAAARFEQKVECSRRF